MGPNFHTPAAPTVNTYNAHKLPAKTVSSAGSGGKSQTYVKGENIPAEWWVLFHSPVLNELIRTGLANSPNLAAAQAALRQAQETFVAQIGTSLFPAVNAELGGQRQKFPGATLGDGIPSNIFNVYNATANVSYNLDVFGAARRQIESLQAQIDYQQFQLLAAYLTLTSNIVTTAITIASLEAQITATKQLIIQQGKQLGILKNQFKLGGISNISVLTQETLVQQTRASLPPLQKNLAQLEHALAVLVGKFPNQKIPHIDLDKLTLPSTLPVSLPSHLVRQRPDVRTAEALLHVASAQVGVATANLFPQISLTGSYGWNSAIPSGLFNSLNSAWNFGGQLTQPIFQGGALRAQRRAAIAAYEASAAQYKQVVLQAFQNVADVLRALETDARTLQAQKKAERAAYENLRLSEQQYYLGGASYVGLLIAQEQYQQTRIARIQAQATRYNDTAALFQALGGGWWNRAKHICHDPVNPVQVSLICP